MEDKIYNELRSLATSTDEVITNRMQARHLAQAGFRNDIEQEIPPILFDGFAVYEALSLKASKRTSHENVSDVLDAIVKLMRDEG